MNSRWSIGRTPNMVSCREVGVDREGAHQAPNELARRYVDEGVISEQGMPAMSVFLDGLADCGEALQCHGDVFAYFRTPDSGYFFVVVAVTANDVDASAAPAPGAIDREPFFRASHDVASPALGLGLRETIVDSGDDGVAVARVRYTWQWRDLLVDVSAQSRDLALLMSALDELDDFASGVEVAA